MIINNSFPSTHFRKTRKAKIDTVVLHYISAININKDDPFNQQAIIDLLTKPIPIGDGKSVKVSAHYLIDRQGQIFRLVNEENVAWHAGKSNLRGKSVRNSCNDFSIGIELMGGKWIKYTDEQYEALIELIKDIKKRYLIPNENIIGHEDIAPGRKTDPGDHFNWDSFFEKLDSNNNTQVINTDESQKNLDQSQDIVKKSDKKKYDKAIKNIEDDNVNIPQENNLDDGTENSLIKTIIDIILSILGLYKS